MNFGFTPDMAYVLFSYKYSNNAKNFTDKAIRKTVFVAETVAIPNPM